MKSESYLNQKKFDFAKNLSAFATDLDDSKDKFPECYEALVNCVEIMHETAGIMAGDRVGEIYDMSEEEAA